MNVQFVPDNGLKKPTCANNIYSSILIYEFQRLLNAIPSPSNPNPQIEESLSTTPVLALFGVRTQIQPDCSSEAYSRIIMAQISFQVPVRDGYEQLPGRAPGLGRTERKRG